MKRDKGIQMQAIEFDIGSIHGEKIVVFGDFMVDEYLQGSVSRISPEAPVPIVHVTSRMKRLGGAGNVVLNLNALGARVTAVGCFGDDYEGNWLVERLNSNEVETTGIFQSKDTITSVKTRVTAQNQQLLRFDQEKVKNAPQEFLTFLREKISSLLENSRGVIISDYGKGSVTAESAKIVIDAATTRNIPVVVDPKGVDYTKYRRATACTPNMKELQLAVGRELHSEEDILEAGIELCLKSGIENILVTRSEAGMSLICGKTAKKKDYPAVAKEVTDVTGAGDTVISIFTVCLALGASYDDCCTLANLAASVVVSKFGASVATPQEIREMIEAHEQCATKIVSINDAKKIAEDLRKQKKKIVFTNGCFDIVHAGHISSFYQARSLGDVLFLGLNSDASIRRIKGDKRPIVTQENRARLLEAIAYIDYITIFEEDTPEELIHEIKPDVLVKGKDWAGAKVAGGDFVEKNGGKVCFIDLEEGLSTTNVINKIITTYGDT